MPWPVRDVRPLLLRRRARRPQLKRDPLGRRSESADRRSLRAASIPHCGPTVMRRSPF